MGVRNLEIDTKIIFFGKADATIDDNYLTFFEVAVGNKFVNEHILSNVAKTSQGGNAD